MDDKTIDSIAQTVHAALSAWSVAHDQPAYPAWSEAEDWMRDSTRQSVREALADPEGSAGRQHDQWVKQKADAGWRYGETKDADRKTHPMMVEFAELPDFEQRKDAIVIALAKALGTQRHEGQNA